MSSKMYISYAIVFLVGMAVSVFLNTFSDNHDLKTTEITGDVEVSGELLKESADNNSYINSLHKLIAEYQDKLSILEDDNQQLIKDLLDSEKQRLLLAQKPTISKKIAAMSDEEVYENLSKAFRQRYLENIDNPKLAAQRLTDIALTDEDEKKVTEEGLANNEVRISISHLPEYVEMTTDQVVASKYRRLYVNMVSSLPVPSALVKWKDLSNDKIIMLKGITFISRNESQHLWGRPKSGDGWEPGRYQVSVYQINNELTLLATKVYTVTEVIDEGPEPAPEVPLYDGPPLKTPRQ